MADPPFMQPPTPDDATPPGVKDQTVVPFRNTRAISSELALSRDKAFRELDIDTQRILTDSVRIYTLLMTGTETVRDHLGEELEVPLTRERISSLNGAFAICKTLLAKTMPDIKQIQIKDENGNELPFNFEMVLTKLAED